MSSDGLAVRASVYLRRASVMSISFLKLNPQSRSRDLILIPRLTLTGVFDGIQTRAVRID
jgi:hypothetical protein